MMHMMRGGLGRAIWLASGEEGGRKERGRKEGEEEKEQMIDW